MTGVYWLQRRGVLYKRHGERHERRRKRRSGMSLMAIFCDLAMAVGFVGIAIQSRHCLSSARRRLSAISGLTLASTGRAGSTRTCRTRAGQGRSRPGQMSRPPAGRQEKGAPVIILALSQFSYAASSARPSVEGPEHGSHSRTNILSNLIVACASGSNGDMSPSTARSVWAAAVVFSPGVRPQAGAVIDGAARSYAFRHAMVLLQVRARQAMIRSEVTR